AYPGQAVVLPPMCVGCGVATNGKFVKKTFAWHHPALYVLLVSPLIYVIVALIVQKRMKVNVPLCPQHSQRRSMGVTLAWVLPVIGIADVFVLPQFHVDSGLAGIVAVCLFLAGVILWAILSNPIKPVSIDASRGEFKGFCEAFLRQIPESSAMAA